MSDDEVTLESPPPRERMPRWLRIVVAGMIFLVVYTASYYLLVDRAVFMKPGQPVRWGTHFRKLPEWARPTADAIFWPVHRIDRRFVRKDYWYDYTSFTESIRERAEKRP